MCIYVCQRHYTNTNKHCINGTLASVCLALVGALGFGSLPRYLGTSCITHTYACLLVMLVWHTVQLPRLFRKANRHRRRDNTP